MVDGEADTPSMSVALAIDLGGTKTRVALVQIARVPARPAHLSGAALQRVLATFATEQDYAAQMALLGEALALASQAAERYGCGAPVGVGVSLGGRIATDGASVAVAPNLRGYEGRPLVADLAARSGGLPVRLAHDAACGLLGERLEGALTGAARCAYLTLSTGTGCAIHLEAPDGATGVTLSIEMGHQLLDGNERVCLCGQVGCLETYTGGRQLALRYGQPIETLPEPEASEMWRAFVEKLSIGLVNLAHLTRVERVALGGAIALNQPHLRDALHAAVAARLRGARLEIVQALHGELAPLVGAAALLTTPEAELLH